MHNLDKEPNNIHTIKVALQSMVETDQTMRQKCHTNPSAYDQTIDQRNTEAMKQIIAQIGWPTIGKVGEEGASHAWLLVQHADHDLAFQKHCLALMKAEPAGEVPPSSLAYLEDRIAVSEGRPQPYGSQFHTTPDGQLKPLPIEDPDTVEARRAKMGMDPLADHQRYMQERYGKTT